MSSIIRGNDNFDSSTGLSYWTSGNQVWGANSTYTLTHGLGSQPKAVQIEFHCVVANNGYSVGDIHVLGSGERYANWGIAILNITSTQIEWGIYGSGVIFRNKNNTTATSQSPSNWRVRLTLIG